MERSKTIPKLNTSFRLNYLMRNPFKRSGYPYRNRKKITPEGEPLEGTGVSRSVLRIVVPIIISIIAISSVRTVDAGYRGILVQFGNVYTSNSLDEGLHFVVPFRDNVVLMEVRTQKVVKSATSASTLSNIKIEYSRIFFKICHLFPILLAFN